MIEMMNFGYCLFIFCALGTLSTSFQVMGQESKVPNAANLGKFVGIGEDVSIDPSSKIQDYVSIGSHSSIGQNSEIGKFSKIGQRCNIGNDVILHEHVKLGNGVKILNGVKIANFASINDNVEVGNGVTVNRYATIGENAKIDEGCFLDDFSVIGSGVEIKGTSYIGIYSSIQSKAVVENLAVIHKSVEILSGETIHQNQVVIQRPSSYDLYRNCASVENIQPDIESAANSDRLNERLHQLIDSQMSNINEICTSRNTPRALDILPKVKTLYLINYHGLERFMDNLGQINANKGNTDSTMECTPFKKLRQSLINEFHFDGSSKNILKPEVEKGFIQLLALELDLERENRVKSDTFCSMLDQIQRGTREVKCQNRKKISFCGESNGISNVHPNIFFAICTIFLPFILPTIF